MFHLRTTSAPLLRASKPLLIAGLCLSAVAAQAQVTRQGDGFLLRVKYTKGQTLRYTMTSNMEPVAQANAKTKATPIKVDMPMVMRILEVTRDKAKAELTVGPISMNGQAMNGQAQKMEMEMDTRNQTTGRGAQGVSVALPQKAVKVGETWSMDSPIPDMGGMGGGSMKATYRFRGMKTVEGRQMAEITYSLTGNARGSGTILILASDGSLWSNTANVQIETPMGNMRVNSVVRRQV